MPRGFLPKSQSRAQKRTFGAQTAVSGIRREFIGSDRIRLHLTALPISITSALKYGSQKLLDFPAGRIQIVGGLASLAFAVTTARAGTINADAAMDWSIGSAAASSVTLATTMVDIIAKQDKTLDGADAAYTTAQAAAVTAAVFDGTGTALDAFLNIGFPTATDVDGDGTVAVTGTIDLVYKNFGDV